MRTLHIRVAGVSYEGRQAYLARLIGNEPVRLIPEPQNPYDANAIAVYIAVPIALDRQINDPNGLSDMVPETEVLHCGYIPRDMAAEIASLLEGETIDCSIEQITGGFTLSDHSIAALGLRLVVQLPDAQEPYYDIPPRP